MLQAAALEGSPSPHFAVRVSRWLNDGVMGFLALVAVVLAATPFFFSLSPAGEGRLIGAEWAIIGVFAVEYASNLALAIDKRAHVLGPWRLLDLATIALPLIALTLHVHGELVASLRDEVAHLHDALVHFREGLHSLIGMHINVASFEMNKVMRVLAIVSVLGMIPAVFFGILSLKLSGMPDAWSVSEVLFGLSVGMLMSLYLFHVKGWLR